MDQNGRLSSQRSQFPSSPSILTGASNSQQHPGQAFAVYTQQDVGSTQHTTKPHLSGHTPQSLSGGVAMQARQFSMQPQAGGVILPGLQMHDASLASDYVTTEASRQSEELMRIVREQQTVISDHEAEQKRTIQKHHEEMITVTESLESLQRVIVDQRMVIEKLRDAGRPQGEPFDELKREMKAMEEAHEARLKQEQERSKRLENQIAQMQASSSTNNVEETLRELRAEMDAIAVEHEEQTQREQQHRRALEQQLAYAREDADALRRMQHSAGKDDEMVQRELSALRHDMQISNKRLSEEMARAAGLQDQLMAAQTKAQTEIAAAQKRVVALEQSLAQKNALVESYAISQTNYVNSKSGGSLSSLEEEKARRKQAERELASMREEVAKMQEERVAIREQHMKKVQALDAMRESLQSEMRRASGQSAVNTEVLELQEEIRNLRKRSVDDAKKLRNENARVHELETALQESKNDADTGRRALDQSLQRQRDLHAQLVEANNRCMAVEHEKSQLELQDLRLFNKEEDAGKAAEMQKETQKRIQELIAQHELEVQGMEKEWHKEKVREQESFKDLLKLVAEGVQGSGKSEETLSGEEARQKLIERLSKSTDRSQFKRVQSRIQEHLRAARGNTAEEMEKELERALLAVSAAEAEAERSKMELMTLQLDKGAKLPELQAQVAELTLKLESEELEKIRRMQDALRQQRLVSELRETNKVLQQEIDAHEAAAALALKRLQDTHDSDVDRLNQQHMDEMSRMHERIFQMEGPNASRDVLEGDALTVQEEIGAVDEHERLRHKQQLEALANKCEWFEKELNGKAEEGLRLHEANAMLKEQLATAKAGLEAVNARVSHLESANTKLGAELQVTQGQVEAAEKQLLESSNKVDGSLLDKCKEDLARVEKQLAESQEALSSKGKELVDKGKELAECLAKLALAQQSNKASQASPLLQPQEKKELFARVEMLKNELMELQKKTDQAAASDAELRGRLKATEVEREMYVTECLKLQKEILRMNQERDSKAFGDENSSSTQLPSASQPLVSNKAAREVRVGEVEEEKTKLLAQLQHQMSLYHEERSRSDLLEQQITKLKHDYEKATGKQWTSA